MFDVISQIPGDTRVAAQKAGTPSSAGAALYDQILRSVLLSMQQPQAAPAAASQAPADIAPSLGVRTLEDVMIQRQFNCSLNDADSDQLFDQLALQPQLLAPLGDSENAATNPLLEEALEPWELLLGRLTLQQRLIG